MGGPGLWVPPVLQGLVKITHEGLERGQGETIVAKLALQQLDGPVDVFDFQNATDHRSGDAAGDRAFAHSDLHDAPM